MSISIFYHMCEALEGYFLYELMGNTPTFSVVLPIPDLLHEFRKLFLNFGKVCYFQKHMFSALISSDDLLYFTFFIASFPSSLLGLLLCLGTDIVMLGCMLVYEHIPIYIRALHALGIFSLVWSGLKHNLKCFIRPGLLFWF